MSNCSIDATDLRVSSSICFSTRSTAVREGGIVRDSACLIAIGILSTGIREIFGTALELGEQEVCWRTFLKSIQERGLHGLTLVVSDDHAGLKAARKTVFPRVPWQRCQFQPQQNKQAYVPRDDMKTQVSADIKAVFNAPSLEEAERLPGIAVKKHEKTASRLSSWMEKNITEGLVIFNLPSTHRERLRTSNMLVRLNEEVRRRIKIIGSFPNREAALRLISFILMERNDQESTIGSESQHSTLSLCDACHSITSCKLAGDLRKRGINPVPVSKKPVQ